MTDGTGRTPGSALPHSSVRVRVGDVWRELAALLAFVCLVTALAMARYRRTLD